MQSHEHMHTILTKACAYSCEHKLLPCTHMYTVCSTPLTVYTSLKEKMVSESFTEVGGGRRWEGSGGRREEEGKGKNTTHQDCHM